MKMLDTKRLTTIQIVIEYYIISYLGNNSVAGNSDSLIYENSTFGIKIQYPSDWLKNTTAQGVTFVLLGERNSCNRSLPDYLLASGQS